MIFAMKRLKYVLSILILASSAAVAQQGNFISKDGTSNITASINFSISTGAITIAPFNTQSEIESGLETSAVRFLVKSNKDWKLATEIGVITSIPLPGNAGPATINSPLSYNHIKFYSTAADNDLYSNMESFPGTVANIKTGFKGNVQKPGNTFKVKFKIVPGFEVDPAMYTIPLIYTLSAQ